MTCERCPCPDVCLQRESHCRIAAKPDRTLFDERVICERARLVHRAPVYPTKWNQAKSLAVALWRFARSGFEVSKQWEFRRRHRICAACPRFVAAEDRCTVCGCGLKIKPWIKAAKCPEGRWEK